MKPVKLLLNWCINSCGKCTTPVIHKAPALCVLYILLLYHQVRHAALLRGASGSLGVLDKMKHDQRKCFLTASGSYK